MDVLKGIAVLVCLLGGCGKPGGCERDTDCKWDRVCTDHECAQPVPARHPAAVAAEALAAEVCACATPYCASKTMESGMQALQVYKDAKGTRADVDAITTATDKMMKCADALIYPKGATR